MSQERVDQIRAKLKGVGPQLGVSYTNQEMIDHSKELQTALAKCLFEKTHAEHLQDKDIRSHINNVANEQGLMDTDIFKKLDGELNELGYTIASFIKGMKGERIVKNALRLLEYDKGVSVIYNVALEDEDSQAEYDAIVVTPYGLFVVEVKNWAGELHLDKWGTLSKENSEDIQYDVPGRMNIKEYLLRKCLKDCFPDYYEGILLFSNRSTHINDDFQQVKICYGGAVVNMIRSHNHGKQILSEDQISKIVDCIKSAHKVQYTTSKINSEEIINDFAEVMAAIEDASDASVTRSLLEEDVNQCVASSSSADDKSNTSSMNSGFKINWGNILAEAATVAACIAVSVFFGGSNIHR